MRCGGPLRASFARTAVAAGGALAPLTVLGAAPKGNAKRYAVGLVGCGYRGSGALKQLVKAGELLGARVEVVATADWFQDRAERVGKAHEVPADRCFAGPAAYRKLIEAGPDIVLLCEPSVFRPLHLEAAVAAGKHVFCEKPVAVDPPGCRRVLRAGEAAEKQGLVVVAGTNLRHEKRRIDAHHAVTREGALGALYGGRVGFLIGHVFERDPIRPKTVDELIATWQSWKELSGDHLVEVAIHHLDLATWFVGHPPETAAGFGGQARRRGGNLYDFFSIDFDYGSGVHVHAMSREIDGCWRWVGLELVYGKGRTDSLRNLDTRKPIRPQASPVPDDLPQVRSSLAQEQVRLLYHIVRDRPLNQARDVTASTAAAILGREAAYSGKRLAWRDLMESPKKSPALYTLRRRPTAEDFETGDVPIPEEGTVPVPGKPAGPRVREGGRR